MIENLRTRYVDALASASGSGNLTDERQHEILAEVRQFLVDMLDVCEQTNVAEGVLVAAYDAFRFHEMYATLADAGACDEPGGAEYLRVMSEWHGFGRPDLETFIRSRANIGPEAD